MEIINQRKEKEEEGASSSTTTTSSSNNINTNTNNDEEDIDENVNDGDDQKEETTKLSDFLKNKPKEFIDFLKENNIPFDSYDIKEIPRFIRLNNRLLNSSNNNNNNEEIIKQLESELKTELIPLKWLPYFYKLKDRVGIASSKSYKNGLIYGMDASSGAAILALNPKPGDNVLDICCAPGTKLSMIADVMNGEGTVTGVDVSSQRLGSCKTILKKYKVPSARLFQCDGSTFNIKAPIKDDPLPFKPQKKQKKQKDELEKVQQSQKEEKDEESVEKDKNNEEIVEEEEKITTDNNNNNNNKRKKISKKKSSKKTYDLDGLYFCNTFYMRYSNAQLYDCVIVDAECSLDASVRHLLQYSKLGRNFIPSELTSLTDLQKRLIQTGFNLLKVGGSLVYSTCSFCKVQNEDVVQWLLDNNKTAKLIPCFENNNSSDKNDNQVNVPYSVGFIENTYRFYPKNGTSGMFISKFTKTP